MRFLSRLACLALALMAFSLLPCEAASLSRDQAQRLLALSLAQPACQNRLASSCLRSIELRFSASAPGSARFIRSARELSAAFPSRSILAIHLADHPASLDGSDSILIFDPALIDRDMPLSFWLAALRQLGERSEPPLSII